VSAQLREAGFEVRTLGAAPGRLPRPAAVTALVGRWRARRPDLVQSWQSWMYHADLAAALLAPVAGDPPVVWGVRQSSLDPSDLRPGTFRVARICARLSRRPARIVYCSHAAERAHAAFGYRQGGTVVIPNGFDTDLFRPSDERRAGLRARWGVAPDAVVIGMAARAHPVKDHRTFLAAMSLLTERHPTARFVLCGDGVVRGAEPFAGVLAADPRLSERAILLGRRDDVPAVLSALDVAVMSSEAGESFPNAVGEAMACGVPCVVTDVGDARTLVGDTGLVVPPRNPPALAAACTALIESRAAGLGARGAAARRRVVERYELGRIADSYHALYSDVLASHRASRTRKTTSRAARRSQTDPAVTRAAEPR
jgi:glycosyltransferase involved in cell wall biosynthesis